MTAVVKEITVDAETRDFGPMSERVERGAAWLDANKPGWYELVRLDELVIQDGSKCILGQVFAEPEDGPFSLGNGWMRNFGRVCDALGSTTAGGFASIDQNGAVREWTRAINNRKEASE